MRSKPSASRGSIPRFPAPRGDLLVQEVGLRNRDGRTLLLGISFHAEPGKILGIIGASGSGKTTLGKLLVGAVQPTVGTVRVDGAKISDWDQDELGHYIGYMPRNRRCSKERSRKISRASLGPRRSTMPRDRFGRCRRGDGGRRP